MTIHITHIDTACILLEINGYRILTDPTLDGAGGMYHHGFGAISRKTGSPAVPPEALNNIDLILLSHHQHKDNFDHSGKALTRSVATVLSTKAAAKAIPGITGLDHWETYAIETPKVPGLRITATPAQHHPWWLPEFFSGKVIGFIIELDGQANGAIYISGDTVFFNGIAEVAARYKIDLGIFHVGAAQFRYLSGVGRYTMDGNDLLKAVNLLQPRTIIPIHQKGWSHFKETEQHLREVIGQHQQVWEQTVWLESGVLTKL